MDFSHNEVTWWSASKWIEEKCQAWLNNAYVHHLQYTIASVNKSWKPPDLPASGHAILRNKSVRGSVRYHCKNSSEDHPSTSFGHIHVPRKTDQGWVGNSTIKTSHSHRQRDVGMFQMLLTKEPLIRARGGNCMQKGCDNRGQKLKADHSKIYLSMSRRTGPAGV